MFTTFAPEVISKLTREFWGRPQRRRWWFFGGGCLFWLLIIYIVVGAFALKAAVYLLCVVAILLAQLGRWGVELIDYPFRARRDLNSGGHRPRK